MKARWGLGPALWMLVLLAPTAGASPWCDQTLIALAPTSVPPGRDTTFTVQVHNIGPDTLTLTAVQVQFPWDGTYRDAGSGGLGPGQTSFFTTTASPPQAAQGPTEVRIVGTSSQDPAGTAPATCNTTFAVTVTAASPGFDAPVLAVVWVALAGVAVLRRR